MLKLDFLQKTMLNGEFYIITLGSPKENNEEMKPKIKNVKSRHYRKSEDFKLQRTSGDHEHRTKFRSTPG